MTDTPLSYLIDRPAEKTQSVGTLILAHGAGAPMDSDFMVAITRQLTVEGVTVVRFEFPYIDNVVSPGKSGRRTASPYCWIVGVKSTPTAVIARIFPPRY